MLRECSFCSKELVRKERPNGGMESLADFKKRRSCDKKCSGRVQAMAGVDPEPRPCPSCHNLMYRRELADGKLETPSSFLRRKYCDSVCAGNERKEGVSAQTELIIRLKYKQGDTSRPRLMREHSLSKAAVERILAGVTKGGAKKNTAFVSPFMALMKQALSKRASSNWTEQTRNKQA